MFPGPAVRSGPSYKPEFQAKVKHLSDNESKLDPVFYCDRPGIRGSGLRGGSFSFQTRLSSFMKTFPAIHTASFQPMAVRTARTEPFILR